MGLLSLLQNGSNSVVLCTAIKKIHKCDFAQKLTMGVLREALKVLLNSLSVMIPTGIQEFILYTLGAILCCHVAKIVLFSTKAGTRYLRIAIHFTLL